MKICISEKAYCIVQLVKPHAEGLDIEELLTNLEADKYADILKDMGLKQRTVVPRSGYPDPENIKSDGKSVAVGWDKDCILAMTEEEYDKFQEQEFINKKSELVKCNDDTAANYLTKYKSYLDSTLKCTTLKRE